MNNLTAELINQAPKDTGGKWLSLYNAETLIQATVQEAIDNLFLNGYDDAANQLAKHFGVNQ